MDSSAPFRVAIVGGGIGGLFCALSLHHHVEHLLQIDVYEQASEYKEIGAGIGLGPNAAKLFHEIGLSERLNAIAGDRNGVWISFRAQSGEEVVTIPSVETKTIRQIPMARSEFLDVLLDSIRERNAARLHTHKRCVSLAQPDTNSVTIHFADKTTATADLVIGCDGIHSPVRAQFATDKPVYSGMIAYRGVIPMPSTLSSYPSTSLLWMAKGRHFLVFPIASNSALNIVAFVTKPEAEIKDTEESWTATCDRVEVERDFAGFEETVQSLIRDMPDPASKWRINYREPLDQWVYMGGRVVLVGDASHAMTPHQGAGAGQAAEDDYILARCLNEYLSHKDTKLEDWMKLYQDVRLPRAQKVARTSKEAGEIYEMTSDDLKDIPYEACLPIIKEKIEQRMKWIWTEDISEAFERAKQESGLISNSNGTL